MTVNIDFSVLDKQWNHSLPNFKKIISNASNNVFDELNQFNDNDISILDVIHCPHLPNDFCNCRKPKPGMFIEAKNKHNINMKKSWIIGDSERDIRAAILAGIKNTILVRSGHTINEANSNATFFLNSIKQINQIISK